MICILSVFRLDPSRLRQTIVCSAKSKWTRKQEIFVLLFEEKSPYIAAVLWKTEKRDIAYCILIIVKTRTINDKLAGTKGATPKPDFCYIVHMTSVSGFLELPVFSSI
jgi:hypothetical protein